MTMENGTFREAYEVLQRHATTLREQDEPNIDDLLDIVNESVAAYKICKLRIDAVEKALEEALVGAEIEGASRGAKMMSGSTATTEPATTPKATGNSSRSNGGADIDDDVPF